MAPGGPRGVGAGCRLDGLVGTPDGRPLCVAAIGTNKTYHY
ncbi:hypothetical protein [Hymenobacter nivis]|nr:hypothetical protein [Hymenobacter nivis]